MAKKHKNRSGGTATNTKHTGIKVVAVLLVLLAVGYVITSLIMGVWNPVQWIKKDKPQEEGEAVIAVSSTGEAMYAGGTYAMPGSVAFITAQSEESSPVGEVIITASLDNEYISGVEYEWEADWTFETSETFGDENNWDDCIEISVYAGETDKAHIRALKPFADRIVLIARLKGNSEIRAECKIDYLSRVTLVSGNAPSISNFYDATQNIECSSGEMTCRFEYSVGTVRGDMQFKGITAQPTSDFGELMTRYITFDFGDFKRYELPSYKENAQGKGYDPDDIFDTNKTTARIATTSLAFELSDFIEDIEQYNRKQVEALYYAWHNALMCEDNEYTDGGGVISNVEYEAAFTYTLNGVELEELTVSESNEFSCSGNVAKLEITLNSYIIQL